MHATLSTRLARLLILLLLAFSTLNAFAQVPGLGGGESGGKVSNLDEIPRDEADAYLAGLTDAQARELLINEIRNRPDPAKPSIMDSSYLTYMINSMNERSAKFESGFQEIKQASGSYSAELARVGEKLFATQGNALGSRIFLTLVVLLAVGAAVAAFAFRPMQNLRQKLREDGHFPIYLRLGRSISGLAMDLAKVGLFVLVAIALTFLVYDKGDPVRVFVYAILILIAAVWAIREVLREMLYSPVSRELFIKDDKCRRIYYWTMIGFFGPTVLLLLLEALLSMLGFPDQLSRLNTLVLATIAFAALILGVILIAREKHRQGGANPDILYAAVKGKRYLLVVAALLVFYSISFKNIVIVEPPQPGEVNTPGYNYFALLMFVFMPMYLRLIYLLVSVQPANALLPSSRHLEDAIDDGLPAASGEGQDFHISKWVRYLFVIPYVVLIFLFMMEGANIGLLSWFSDGAGAEFGEAATGVFMAAIFGVIAWNVINAIINKNLPRIAKDPRALMGSEGGGDEQATRLQTILPILRMVAMTLIVIVVGFSILSSLGVNTTPLLAGAGVIGIAIGFGAQKLVQDVVSGLFFLFEDAFRIGEYIDTGDLKGTVESTSLRSLKLRHHLGAVQTVPYGEIRSVKNLSRDFVIMKLSFRVPFGTDIEVVRKTIKKVGQGLLEHPELGPDFIAPLKSQGVQTADDDALVIRMKFTAKPGKQWMIKREAYRLVQEALAARGIEFAPRQVTVHVPEAERANPEAIKQAVGAAAAAAVDDASQPKKPLPDEPG